MQHALERLSRGRVAAHNPFVRLARWLAYRFALYQLTRAQRMDGAWIACLSGKDSATSGTASVLRGLVSFGSADPRVFALTRRAVSWLVGAQHDDGGWGPEPGHPPTRTETVAAVEALSAPWLTASMPIAAEAVRAGTAWLSASASTGTPPEDRPSGTG